MNLIFLVSWCLLGVIGLIIFHLIEYYANEKRYSDYYCFSLINVIGIIFGIPFGAVTFIGSLIILCVTYSNKIIFRIKIKRKEI